MDAPASGISVLDPGPRRCCEDVFRSPRPGLYHPAHLPPCREAISLLKVLLPQLRYPVESPGGRNFHNERASPDSSGRLWNDGGLGPDVIDELGPPLADDGEPGQLQGGGGGVGADPLPITGHLQQRGPGIQRCPDGDEHGSRWVLECLWSGDPG